MTTDSRLYDREGRPTLTEHNTHDLDTAQHFLADHATELIVAFDHHAVNPEVFIYVATSDGTLSAGDYYLWPLLHQTAERINAEIVEMRRKENERLSWRYYGARLTKWVRRMTLLQTLIRIRKSTVHALCAWDLQDKRPEDLVVLRTERDLTGLTRQEALVVAETK